MSWSEESWEAIRPIYTSIIEMPFIRELLAGTLPLDKFQFYIMQDSGYLAHFARALALIGARAGDTDLMLTFLRFAENAVLVEQALHESYFQEFGITGQGTIEPACHHYIHFLKSTAALDTIESAMAAVLPCFWIYWEVGNYIAGNQQPGDNRYQKWIDTYADEAFGEAVKRAIALCDEAAINATPATRASMKEAFITASHLEFDFWDSAYRLRRWPETENAIRDKQ